MFTDNWAVAGSMQGTVLAQGGISVTPLPTPTGLAGAVGNGSGSIPQGTYFYRVSAFNSIGETLASTEISYFAPDPVAANVIRLTWTPVVGATGYKLYGRASGAELLLATIQGGINSSYLDASLTPVSGALPTANTTGKASFDAGISLPSAFSGTSTLVAGTVTVPTTAIAAGSRIFLTRNTPGGAVGDLSAPSASIVAGVSFVINSSSGTDTSTVNWWFTI